MRRSDADVEYGYYIDAQKEFLEIGEVNLFACTVIRHIYLAWFMCNAIFEK